MPGGSDRVARALAPAPHPDRAAAAGSGSREKAGARQRVGFQGQEWRVAAGENVWALMCGLDALTRQLLWKC